MLLLALSLRTKSENVIGMRPLWRGRLAVFVLTAVLVAMILQEWVSRHHRDLPFQKKYGLTIVHRRLRPAQSPKPLAFFERLESSERVATSRTR